MLTRRRLFGGVASLAVISTALATHAQTPPAPDSHPDVTLTGQVTSVAEGAMEGVVVTVKREGSTIAHSVISNAQGKYPLSSSENSRRGVCSEHPCGGLRPGQSGRGERPL